MPDSYLDAAMETGKKLTERRFFGELILTANVILHLGTPAQQQRVHGLLDELTAEEDPIIADFAQWALENPPTEEELAESYPHPKQR